MLAPEQASCNTVVLARARHTSREKRRSELGKSTPMAAKTNRPKAAAGSDASHWNCGMGAGSDVPRAVISAPMITLATAAHW